MARIHENSTDPHAHSSAGVKSAISKGASQFQKHHGDGEAKAQPQPSKSGGMAPCPDTDKDGM
jgi:hypothetical protein